MRDRLDQARRWSEDARALLVPPVPVTPAVLKLLDELNLAKYKKKFRHEDLTEVSMFLAMLEVGANGTADLRAILREVGMSLGHREKVLLALTTRPPPITVL